MYGKGGPDPLFLYSKHTKLTAITCYRGRRRAPAYIGNEVYPDTHAKMDHLDPQDLQYGDPADKDKTQDLEMAELHGPRGTRQREASARRQLWQPN